MTCDLVIMKYVKGIRFEEGISCEHGVSDEFGPRLAFQA